MNQPQAVNVRDLSHDEFNNLGPDDKVKVVIQTIYYLMIAQLLTHFSNNNLTLTINQN